VPYSYATLILSLVIGCLVSRDYFQIQTICSKEFKDFIDGSRLARYHDKCVWLNS